MNTINSLLSVLTDRILSIISSWPPLLALLVVSVVAGMAMAVVFRFTSNQRALRQEADRSRAQVLAIKLFKDDLATMFSSLGRLLRHTGLRLWHSLPPMLVMMLPFVLLLTQLARWYEHCPLEPGETAVVEFEVAEAHWPQFRNLTLDAPPAIAVETPSLRDEEAHTVYWRIRAVEPDAAVLRWHQGRHSFEKTVETASDPQRLCAVDARRAGPGIGDRLLHPGEPGFGKGSPVRGIVVHYPRRSTSVLGVDVPWWATFLVASILAAVAARPLVKVQF